jgi:hypothetical protein
VGGSAGIEENIMRRARARRYLFSFLAALLGVGALGAAVVTSSASAAPPKALILSDSVSPFSATDGTNKSLEQQQAEIAGFAVTLVSAATWQSMTASQFAAYQVLVIGDPTCTHGFPYGVDSNASTWEGVVMSSGGNRVLIGTDPTFHNNGPSGTQRGDLLERNGIAFAGAKAGATGMYIDLSCRYESDPSGTAVPILDGLTTHGPNAFTVGGAPCAGAISIVAQSGPTTGLHDADLSNWSCSVHEFFDKFPSDFTPLAIATDPVVPKTYSAHDVDTGASVSGSPYIMLAGGGITIVSDITLTPKTATNPVGTSHTVTATVKHNGVAVSGVHVTFTIDSGPNVGKTGSGTTNANGQTTFTYTDTGGAGTDEISASFTDASGALQKATATKIWTAGTVDRIPPTCVLSSVVTGPPKAIKVTAQDTGSGLASITVTTHTNATVSVPAFSSGTKSAVVVTGTKTNQALPAQITLQVKDVAGNVTNCDPVIATLRAGHAVAAGGLAAAERFVQVTNGRPGLDRVTVAVNGKASTISLGAGSSRLLDVGSAMHAGSHNHVRVVGSGAGTAGLLVWDGS